MRRLIGHTSKLTAILFFGVFLALYSIATFSIHGNSVKSGCAISCHSDGQHAGISNQKKETDEDDIKPTPPLLTWPQVPVSLTLLYILPSFAVLWFASKRNEIHLTTQMRF
jgi:hypothetical protein